MKHITTDRQLQDYCHQLSSAAVVAFDTEFVSEDTYRPDLCLIQVAADGQLAVVDPCPIGDLTPFWEALACEGHETIVHAGREEFLFCLRAVGKPPAGWFDVQMAAGMIGTDYPASYANLVHRLLGKSVHKGETRTDWRRRPLTSHQLEYALHDVEHLPALRCLLQDRLQRLGRTRWLQDELRAWQDRLQREEHMERWRRVSGISGLSERSLAIVRQLWRWREAEAERLDLPPKRVLRDDLVTELAKRGTADMRRIRAVRGLQRRNLQQRLPQIADCISLALRLPQDELPKRHRRQSSSQATVMAQFLATALASICREQHIAPGLVGSVQDVRDLVAQRLQLNESTANGPPALTQGWRAEVVGQKLDDLLRGDLAIRITDPRSDHPLTFESVARQLKRP